MRPAGGAVVRVSSRIAESSLASARAQKALVETLEKQMEKWPPTPEQTIALQVARRMLILRLETVIASMGETI